MTLPEEGDRIEIRRHGGHGLDARSTNCERAENAGDRLRFRAEKGGYWAEMPECPVCFTEAESMDDLKENVREAVRCFIDAGYADRHVTERTEEPEILSVAL